MKPTSRLATLLLAILITVPSMVMADHVITVPAGPKLPPGPSAADRQAMAVRSGRGGAARIVRDVVQTIHEKMVDSLSKSQPEFLSSMKLVEQSILGGEATHGVVVIDLYSFLGGLHTHYAGVRYGLGKNTQAALMDMISQDWLGRGRPGPGYAFNPTILVLSLTPSGTVNTSTPFVGSGAFAIRDAYAALRAQFQSDIAADRAQAAGGRSQRRDRPASRNGHDSGREGRGGERDEHIYGRDTGHREPPEPNRPEPDHPEPDRPEPDRPEPDRPEPGPSLDGPPLLSSTVRPAHGFALASFRRPLPPAVVARAFRSAQRSSAPSPENGVTYDTPAAVLRHLMRSTPSATRWRIATTLQELMPWGLADSRVWLDLNGDGDDDFCRAVVREWIQATVDDWARWHWLPEGAQYDGSGIEQRGFISLYLCNLSNRQQNIATYSGEVALVPLVDHAEPRNLNWIAPARSQTALICRDFDHPDGGTLTRCTPLHSGFTSVDVQKPVELSVPANASNSTWVEIDGHEWPDYCWIEESADPMGVSLSGGYSPQQRAALLQLQLNGPAAGSVRCWTRMASFARSFGPIFIGLKNRRYWADVDLDGLDDFCRVVDAAQNQVLCYSPSLRRESMDLLERPN